MDILAEGVKFKPWFRARMQRQSRLICVNRVRDGCELQIPPQKVPEELPEESSARVLKNTDELDRIVLETPVKQAIFGSEMVRDLPLEPFSKPLMFSGALS